MIAPSRAVLLFILTAVCTTDMDSLAVSCSITQHRHAGMRTGKTNQGVAWLTWLMDLLSVRTISYSSTSTASGCLLTHHNLEDIVRRFHSNDRSSQPGSEHVPGIVAWQARLPAHYNSRPACSRSGSMQCELNLTEYGEMVPARKRDLHTFNFQMLYINPCNKMPNSLHKSPFSLRLIDP